VPFPRIPAIACVIMRARAAATLPRAKPVDRLLGHIQRVSVQVLGQRTAFQRISECYA